LDPDEALKRLRELADKIDSPFGFDLAEAKDLAIQFQALDGWLTRGGFLPKDWARSRNAE
jgi:hypothetical protein